MNNKEHLKSLHKQMEKENLGPLWASIHDLNTIEPKSKPIPYLWKKDLIRKYLDKSERLLTVGDGADRRAVFLINPGMKDLEPVGWGGATQTLFAAVQAVKPGEIAPAHRHTTTALRYIINGEGARGRVNGEQITFEPGDFLTTPTWTWHDHTNVGDEEVWWMDCLDVPFTKFLGTCFTEFYDEMQQELYVPDDYSSTRYQGGMIRPVNDRDPKIAPLGRYKWELTKTGLDGLSMHDPDPIDGHAVEYINPSTGKDANDRIGARMQKLPTNFKGIAHRHVHSTIYHVVSGRGYTVMNGVRFDWKKGDFFVAPSWTWHEHVNTSDEEESFLFSTNDLPIMESFNFEVKEDYGENGGHQKIESVFNPSPIK
ncbi:cupin domain-containing protein [Thalassobacillus sp. CUG 92003]|uniref:cupin domain-containing protein n=1 Tax=Thalassobacillus sp. CUG 92003 TaxID=2736641 RepID=UPI0015E6F2D1|nr:cupin domain-containing protein [Thalassobacillus sp. CUG 92003]